MGLVATYPMQGGQPSRYRNVALRGGVNLPWGGQTGAGGDVLAMTALQNVGGTAQPEIWTLTLSGSGTCIFQFVSSGTNRTLPIATGTTTAAQLNTLLQAIWPAWVLPSGSVTGSTGGPYTITFGAVPARIGGAIQSITATGSASLAVVRTQRGSVGAGQYDICDGITFTTPDSFLIDTIPLGPTGALSTTPYGAVNDTTFSEWAWIEGFFNAADSPNLTDAMIATSLKINYYIGTSVTQPGCEIRLIQA